MLNKQLIVVYTDRIVQWRHLDSQYLAIGTEYSIDRIVVD